MGNSESKKTTVRYQAVCAECDLKGPLYETEAEAYRIVSEHQEKNATHRVEVVAIQTNR